MQETLFDICSRRHRGNRASVAANKVVNKNTDNAAILAIFMRRLEATSKQIGEELGRPGNPRPLNQFSGRISFLIKQGFLIDTGRMSDGCRILRWTGKGI